MTGTRPRTFVGPGIHGGRLQRETTEPVRLNGMDGWKVVDSAEFFLTRPDGIQVQLRMDSGATLGGLRADVDDLTRIHRELDFGPWPDMTWVGSR